jgi:hypothetical protein
LIGDAGGGVIEGVVIGPWTAGSVVVASELQVDPRPALRAQIGWLGEG